MLRLRRFDGTSTRTAIRSIAIGPLTFTLTKSEWAPLTFTIIGFTRRLIVVEF